MNINFSNSEEILDCFIPGFHMYAFEKSVHLTFVSRNLCSMLGYEREELISERDDLYAPLIHPSDRKIYSDFIYKLAHREQTLTAEYRIVRKDGSVIYVNDTLTSKRMEDGTLAGYSVLTDITSVKAENKNLSFINDTIPCGLVKYTCEKHPKITYVNGQMLKFLRLPDSDKDDPYVELYKENIYLTIPHEERRRFSHFLSQVYSKGSPISGELSVLRHDGTKARLYGWVAKVKDEHGNEEFQSVCMDVTEVYKTKRANGAKQYIKALSEVYDKIFEYDFANKTVKYLYGTHSETFDRIQNIPMQLEEATEQWIYNTVIEEDRAKTKEFFEKILNRETILGTSRPPQIRFKARSLNGEVKKYIGIFLKIDRAVSLFCSKIIIDEEEADTLRSENLALKNINESMQELVMHFTEGIVAFEIDNGTAKPLYSSDNICKFFGYTKEEWARMSREKHSIEKIISHSGLSRDDITKLLEAGEAEFSYWDTTKNTERRIKAICSQKYSDGTTPRYVMLYHVDKGVSPNPDADTSSIYIRTFGYFDVFVDDKPIAFRNKKSKELFALLVDRRGGYVTSEEAISFLWEDEPVNSVTLARYRKVALRLKNILEEYGIADIVESVDGKRRVVCEKVRCDLYDYLSRKEEYAQLFNGSYLTNYSWSETTLGELLGEHIY